MKFLDEVKIYLKAINSNSGYISFRNEKFIESIFINKVLINRY